MTRLLAIALLAVAGCSAPPQGWTPHRPGDPCPAPGAQRVAVLFNDHRTATATAQEIDWRPSPGQHTLEVIAWRPAQD